MQDNKALILQKALALFVAKGYEAVGVQELCDAAGVTKPTLYYYFGSKEGLFAALMQTFVEPFFRRLDEAAVYLPQPKDYYHDLQPVLLRVADEYFALAKSSPEVFRLLVSLNFMPPQSSCAAIKNHFQNRQNSTLEGLFLKASEVHGNLRGREKLLATYFGSLVTSSVLLHLNQDQTNQNQTSVPPASDLVKIFMHGIFSG